MMVHIHTNSWTFVNTSQQKRGVEWTVAKQNMTTPIYRQKTAKQLIINWLHWSYCWNGTSYIHGLAPSATRSIRRDARLTSLWSFCAKRAQCISRDFTTATVAADHTSNKYANHTKHIARHMTWLFHSNWQFQTTTSRQKVSCNVKNNLAD